MTEEIPIFDYPEFEDTFKELLSKVLNESQRGAILIGTEHVADQLERLILEVLPPRPKKYRTSLLKYPGPLSSFSAKLELCFAFRIIPIKVYDSLNSLRKIRNRAAHSKVSFNLQDNDLDRIFDFGEGFPSAVNNSSIYLLTKLKLDGMKSHFKKDGVGDQEANALIAKILKEKETVNALEEQLPHWKLIIGLSLACTVLKFYSNKTCELLKRVDVWSSLSQE